MHRELFIKVIPRAVQQREIQAVEEESKLKELRIQKHKKKSRKHRKELLSDLEESAFAFSQQRIRSINTIRRTLYNETVHKALSRLQNSEHYMLPLVEKVAVLESLCNHVLETPLLRLAIDEREKAVEEEDLELDEAEEDNWDNCGICYMGGSLVCCDTCPGSYHLKVAKYLSIHTFTCSRHLQFNTVTATIVAYCFFHTMIALLALHPVYW
jgi:hypothetical protein